MKTTVARRITSLLLAGAVLAPAVGIATAATAAPLPGPTPVSLTQSLTPLDLAIYQTGQVRSGKLYTTNMVPFSKLTNGKTFVGDNTGTTTTNTWIPWTGATVTVKAKSHAVVSSTPAAGAVHVKGAILTKYLFAGGEDLLGRPISNEVKGQAGTHGGSLPTVTQTFKKTTKTGTATADIIWTSKYGAKTVKGAIRTGYLDRGGKRMMGAPTTDETKVVVNGKTYTQQKFERGTLRWSASTGVIKVS